MEIIITIGIVVAAIYFLARKIKTTKEADCTTCSSCSTDCTVYTPERAKSIAFINNVNKETSSDH